MRSDLWKTKQNITKKNWGFDHSKQESWEVLFAKLISLTNQSWITSPQSRMSQCHIHCCITSCLAVWDLDHVGLLDNVKSESTGLVLCSPALKEAFEPYQSTHLRNLWRSLGVISELLDSQEIYALNKSPYSYEPWIGNVSRFLEETTCGGSSLNLHYFLLHYFIFYRLSRTCFNEDGQVFVNDTVVVLLCCFSCGFQATAHLKFATLEWMWTVGESGSDWSDWMTVPFL